MKAPIIITALVGVALVAGAWNKTAIRYARKVGKIFSPLSGLSFTMSRLSEQEKDSIARLWMLWIGGMILAATILGIIFRISG
jgi:hypothetical protein